MKAQLLSYHDMTMDPSGKIMTDEAKAKLRKQFGYCLTCPNVPVLLYDIQRNRLNPLWSARTPRAADGQCENGRCLQCNPRATTRRGSMDSGGSNHSRDSHGETRSASRLSVDGASRVSTDGSSIMASSVGSVSRSGHRGSAPSAVTVRSGHRTRTRRPPSNVHQQSAHLGAMLERDQQARNGPRRPSTDDASHVSSESFYTAVSAMSRNQPAATRRGTPTGPSDRRSRLNREHSDDSGESMDFSTGSEARILSRTIEYDRHRTAPSRSSSGGSLTVISSSDERSHDSGDAVERELPASPAHSASRSPSSASVPDNQWERRRHPPLPRPPPPSEEFRSSSTSLHMSTAGSAPISPCSSHAEDNAMFQASTQSFGGYESLSDSIPAGSGHRDAPYRSALQTASSFRADDATAGRMRAEEAPPADGGAKALEELKVLVQALSGDENLGILTEILISSMNLHKTCEPLQAYALRVMAGAFDNSVVESEVLMAKILQAMQGFASSLEVQAAGCAVLHSLGRQACNGPLMARTGACQALTAALTRHIGDEGLVSGAVSTLRMLSVVREAQAWLEGSGSATQVTSAMQCHPSVANLQRDGCALLSNIAVNPEQRTVSEVSVEVVETVAEALRTHGPSDPTVAASACFALKNLTYQESNLKALAKIPDAVEMVARAASTGGLDDAYAVLEKLQLALAEEQSLREQTITRVSSMGSVVDIVEVMKHNCRDHEAVLRCMEALTALLKSTPSQLEVLHNDGEVLAYLLQCTELYATDSQIQQEASVLMDCLFNAEGDDGADASTHPMAPLEPLPVSAESQE